jgi:hypothetical protein
MNSPLRQEFQPDVARLRLKFIWLPFRPGILTVTDNLERHVALLVSMTRGENGKFNLSSSSGSDLSGYKFDQDDSEACAIANEAVRK